MEKIDSFVKSAIYIFFLVFFVVIFYNYIQNKIDKYFYHKKQKTDKRNRLNLFYSKIKMNRKELKPFLNSLDLMILDISKQDLTQSDLNKILTGYHFYQDVLEKITLGQGVKEDDLIYFAELHVNYVNFVKDWKKMKRSEFYSKNNFFNIGLN